MSDLQETARLRAHLKIERDAFLRNVVHELYDGNERWPGLWSRLDSLMRERDALAAAVSRLHADLEQARAALRAKDAVLGRLADKHHRTLTGSRKHDPENIADFRQCPCLTCREAALALAEPHTQPCDCAWCRFQAELAALTVEADRK